MIVLYYVLLHSMFTLSLTGNSPSVLTDFLLTDFDLAFNLSSTATSLPTGSLYTTDFDLCFTGILFKSFPFEPDELEADAEPAFAEPAGIGGSLAFVVVDDAVDAEAAAVVDGFLAAAEVEADVPLDEDPFADESFFNAVNDRLKNSISVC